MLRKLLNRREVIASIAATSAAAALPRTLGAREIGGPYGAIVELLALTGQRR